MKISYPSFAPTPAIQSSDTKAEQPRPDKAAANNTVTIPGTPLRDAPQAQTNGKTLQLYNPTSVHTLAPSSVGTKLDLRG